MSTNQHDLVRSTGWAVENLGWFVDALAAIESDLDIAMSDVETSRLCARRGFSDRRCREILDTVGWLVTEGFDQIWDLTEELRPIVEPAHSGVTYGVATGIYPFAPFDARRCGTIAGAGRHRRRGQVLCQPCTQAVAHYNRLRRASATPIGPQDLRLITIAS